LDFKFIDFLNFGYPLGLNPAKALGRADTLEVLAAVIFVSRFKNAKQFFTQNDGRT